MQILKAPEAGCTNAEVTDHRLLSIVLWLSEFRLSSLSILATVVGLPPTRKDKKTQQLFSRLLRMGLVVEGKNHLLGRESIFMAGPAAQDYAWVRGLPDLRFTFDYGLMPTHRQIYHDLSVQQAMARRLSGTVSIQGEHQLLLERGGKWDTDVGRMNKPDALVTNVEGQTFAYEYEMTLKAQSRVYQAFQSHILAFQNELYEGVMYLFPSEALKAKYEAILKPALWPIFSKDRAKGHLRREKGLYQPGDWRTHFRFKVENYYQLPAPPKKT